MELCKAQVQVEEYVIHVAEATDSHTYLRFCLLGSTWLPRPVGVCLWSLLHIMLVLYYTLVLLVLYLFLLLCAVLLDAVILLNMALIFGVLYPCYILSWLLGFGIGFAVSRIWLVITLAYRCCTMTGRSPGQSVGQYILSGGGRPVAEEGVPMFTFLRWSDFMFNEILPIFTLALLMDLAEEPLKPYWRVRFQSVCREIVPLYDAITI